MRAALRFLAAAVIAGAVFAAATVPVGAGILTITVTGQAACNPATGDFDITWTIAANNASPPPAVTTAIQTPTGTDIASTLTPPAIPQNGHSTATGSVPGTTTGPVSLVVSYAAAVRPPDTGSVTVDGTCVAVPSPVTADVQFTG